MVKEVDDNSQSPAEKFRHGGILVCNPSVRELGTGRSLDLSSQNLL